MASVEIEIVELKDESDDVRVSLPNGQILYVYGDGWVTASGTGFLDSIYSVNVAKKLKKLKKLNKAAKRDAG